MKKQRNVHGGETRKGAFPGKKYAALALCVSLWMAGGSVASAKDLYLDENNQPKYVSGSKPEGATVESSGTTLTVTGGNWNSWYIFGCKNDSAPLSNYILNINNITNVNYVYGAYAETKAERNEVTLNGRNIQANNVYGGYVKGSGVATCNKVNLENGATVKGDVYGGCPESEGSATYNEVTLDDATANANVYGGRTTGDGTSTGNVVTLKNGATVKVDVYGGRTGYGTATYNKVMLKNGATVEKNVYGGYAGGNGNTQNNEVTLDSSTVEGNVYGGYVQGGGNNKKATDNTVTLNSATVTGNVYGGLSNSASGGDSVTGNTLNLSGANTAKSIANFDTVNIVSAKWGTPALIQGGDIGTVNSISTEGIAFSGTNAIAAGGTTPLIQGGMGGYDQTKVTGSTYTLGTTLQGEGHAVVDENNLMFVADTATAAAREQTHNTVMGAEVGMAALAVGNDFIGAATEGLALAANTGADGVASFAQMGGGAMRQETGSHVDVHTWNAILGLGHKNEKARGTFQYGAFFEYGRGNYTTHAENNLRGDGNAQYTGGGLLAKYTMKNDVYVEGSLRIGTVKDDARDVMSDGAGNSYSYKTSAGYQGFHIGVGKEIKLADGNSVDVYGKYFFNHKNGVSFNAGGHYDLDAVTSSVLRLGARYTVKRDKWNFYGGLAYEHELDGKATGTADGAAIRAADTSGGSVRAEIGATMQPDENSPWSLDLNFAGFAGKKEGFSGGVSVAYMF